MLKAGPGNCAFPLSNLGRGPGGILMTKKWQSAVHGRAAEVLQIVHLTAEVPVRARNSCRKGLPPLTWFQI